MPQNNIFSRQKWVWIFASLIAGMLCTPANAEYSLCNKTSYALSAAIGYVDQNRMMSRGWWRLRPGQCKVALTDVIKPGRYYVYAEAIQGHKGALRTWSGDTPLCVETESLFTLRDQSFCVNDIRHKRDFFIVDVPSKSNGSWRTEFVEENNYTIYSAEIAGVQRLLKDVGQNITHIDGSLGRTTQGALRKYRRQNGLGDSGVIDDTIIDTLIAEANQRDAKIGLFFCNDTRQPIWAALAIPEDGEERYRSMGWWQLRGLECTRILRNELTASHYYVYGVMDLGDQEAPIIGGTQPFCISNAQFDVAGRTECDSTGYEEAAFRRFDIGSDKAWTYRFTPSTFNPELLPDTDNDTPTGRSVPSPK